ncbi:MAG TPA: DUF86 domain-containing protein [Spirochaetota bacterium]|nr:DUF86 domain-containing protein [Spirochaetota bacterium]
MRSNRDSSDYINDILFEITQIKEFSSGLTYEEFSADNKTIYAIIRSFEIIGEAVKNIDPEIRDKYPDIPWKRIAGMRDKLIHEYFGVSISILWKTIQDRVPELEKKLSSLKSEL